MEIRWSLPAAADLELICARIERDNPDAARRVARATYDGCTQLKRVPPYRALQQANSQDAANLCFRLCRM